MTGQELSYDTHAVLEFGTYIQCHKEHTNYVEDCIMGVICLAPTEGDLWLMSLLSGSQEMCNCWTKLPIPQEAITHVSQIGCLQGRPSTITYTNRFGPEIADTLAKLRKMTLPPQVPHTIWMVTPSFR